VPGGTSPELRNLDCGAHPVTDGLVSRTERTHYREGVTDKAQMVEFNIWCDDLGDGIVADEKVPDVNLEQIKGLSMHRKHRPDATIGGIARAAYSDLAEICRA